MEEENKLEGKIEEKEEKLEQKIEEKKEVVVAEEKTRGKKEGEKAEAAKKSGKAEEKKSEKKEKPRKTSALVHGKNLSISTKQAVAICNLVRGKRIDDSIAYLEQVTKKKKVVPMKGEIPHRKQEKIMSGRYPVNASKVFIKLLKSLAANASVNGLDIDKVKIKTAKANQASRPLRRFGVTRFKRTHVFLEAQEIGGMKEK